MKYLEHCVNSALQQTYDNYEIHIYDNGSTDGTLERIFELEKEHQKIIVHQVPNIYKNSFREAVDHAFQNLDTDYITFLCSDDYLSPDYLTNCMKIISHDPEKIKCIQSYIAGDHDGTIHAPQGYFYKSIEEFKKLCMERSPVMTPTVVYSKDLYPLKKWSPYGGPAHKKNNVVEAGAGDYDMFCNFADNNVFIYPVNTFLGYYYRWHSGQATWKVIEEKKELDYDQMIQKYWKNKWNL